MLVINPRGPQGLWLLPSALPQNPGWLEPLRRTLCCADTAILFPLLDRGEGLPDEAVHQALLHDVLHGLHMGDVSVSHILALLINSTEAGDLLRGNGTLHAMLDARTRAR
jgi:hypothetical protein